MTNKRKSKKSIKTKEAAKIAENELPKTSKKGKRKLYLLRRGKGQRKFKNPY